MNRVLKFLFASLALAASAASHAQKWPDKPVTIVVPYPPGGNVDTAARIVAQGLQQTVGGTFIVENKAGAGGMIGVGSVAKAAPDGYTLLVASNGPLLYSPVIFGRANYKWDKDFVPVSSISFTPMLLQVHPSIPAKTVNDFLALVKKEPGKLIFASPGAGTSNHLVAELMRSITGAEWITVHYKGNAPAITDLLAGHVNFSFDQVSIALPHIKQGKLRPIAVTSDKRVASLPDVPTFAEAGLKGMEASTFTGMLAPAGTPKAIVDQLNRALVKILQDKQVIRKFDGLGAEARASTPGGFTTYLKQEDAKWTPVIKRANINAQ
jgi:tripartite-type tricarboxylate transporter receptor subunit TctC